MQSLSGSCTRYEGHRIIQVLVNTNSFFILPSSCVFLIYIAAKEVIPQVFQTPAMTSSRF